MSATEDPWGDYHRLQQKLLGKTHVDDRAWGLEAALDRALEFVADADELDRTARSVARRQRSRAHLLLVYGDREAMHRDVADSHLDAKRALDGIARRLPPEDWQLLNAVADGHDYSELGATLGRRPGALRVRVLRLRRAVSDFRHVAA